MRISDWSSDVCSSDLLRLQLESRDRGLQRRLSCPDDAQSDAALFRRLDAKLRTRAPFALRLLGIDADGIALAAPDRRPADRRHPPRHSDRKSTRLNSRH